MARILVVDDIAENLSLLERHLRGVEFDVAIALGAEAALELCTHRSFDLVLLAVVMTGVDGFEVCRRLKQDPRTASLPVVFLAARSAEESERLAAYELGAVDYVQKPVAREELVARLRARLRREQSRARLLAENAALRRRLDTCEQALDDVTEYAGDLQVLRHEQTTQQAGLLMLDRAGRIMAADAAVSALLGELHAGRPLASGTHAAARLARLVEQGARTADLPLPRDGEPPHIVHVRVVPLPDGACAVLLQDVTRVREVERRMGGREPFAAAVDRTRQPRRDAYSMTGFVGRSACVQGLMDMVSRLRQTRSTVLIQGETGTGKELLARALHFDGPDADAPFIPVHCGAIAPELVESELFGHEKGAFTGAQHSREGLFRAADGGTLFLDEIAETSQSVQVKLLRVLQRGEIRPVGASQPRSVDVRILAATNRDLWQCVREGRFREDLYYRLEVVALHLPPLRERLEDLPLLVEHFLTLGNRRHGRMDRPVRSVSRRAMECLLAYPWPGNVREVENVIERAFALGVGEVLHEDDLPRRIVDGQQPEGHAPSHGGAAGGRPAHDLRSQREAAERSAILRALREVAGDKLEAAHQLGMSRSTLYRRLKELGL